MSNKEWDKISYNQSYVTEMEIAKKKWDELIAERPIQEENYQPVVDEHKEKIKGSDIY